MAEPRPILKPESIGRECEASLRRLGVERIDEAFSEKHLACTVHKLGSFGSLKFPCGFAHAHEAQESYGEERRSAVSTDWGLVACGLLAACCQHGRCTCRCRKLNLVGVARRDAGPDGRSHQTDLQSRPRSVSITDSAGSRGPCASAADHRAAPGQGRSVAILGRRQIGSALGLRVVSEYLWRACHHPAGNGDALASRRLAIVLALEVQVSTGSSRGVG
jgi:hypothetical protein